MNDEPINLPPLTTDCLAYLEWAIIKWTERFRAFPNDPYDADSKALYCPPQYKSALCDAINAHRYYLTLDLPCRCEVCLPKACARIKAMAAFFGGPGHVTIETINNPPPKD